MDECAALAFSGASDSAMLTAGAAPLRLSDRFVARAASGFSHRSAMKAAMRSQAIMAQNTLFQEPVLANNQAAPGPAKAAARPLAV